MRRAVTLGRLARTVEKSVDSLIAFQVDYPKPLAFFDFMDPVIARPHHSAVNIVPMLVGHAVPSRKYLSVLIKPRAFSAHISRQGSSAAAGAACRMENRIGLGAYCGLGSS